MTRLICGAIRAGKTHKLVEMCLQYNGIMLTFDKHRAKQLMHEYPKLQAMSWEEFNREGQFFPRQKICFDDLDLYIKNKIRAREAELIGYTINDRPEILALPEDVKKFLENNLYTETVKKEFKEHMLGKWADD